MGIKCYAYLDFMYVFVVLYRLVLLLLLQAEARRKLYHRTYLRIAWKIPSHREGRNWVSKLWNSWLPKQLKADANFIPASRKHGREGREGRDGRHGLPGPVGRAGDYPEFVSPFDVENEPNPEFYQFWDLSATTSNHNNEDPPRTTDFDDGILPRTALGHDAAFIWEDMFDDQSVFLGLDTGLDDPVKGKTTSKPDTGSSLNTIILPHVGLGLGCNDLRGHIDGGHKCTYCSDSFTNKGQLRYLLSHYPVLVGLPRADFTKEARTP